MKAIILAAGRGSRMKAMTECKPKCLLKLGEKTLLEWQTEALYAAGISSITLVRGYCKEMLTDPRYHYFDNRRWAETNMVYTLTQASTLLENETCLISYSDIVYHPSIIKSLLTTSGDIVISYDQKWLKLWKERFTNPLDDAETFRASNGKLELIGEKTANLEDIQGQYMGLLKVSPHGWKQITDYLNSLEPTCQDRLDMTSLLRYLIAQGNCITTIPIQGLWCEVDREEDFKLYEKKLLSSGWLHDWRFPNERFVNI